MIKRLRAGTLGTVLSFVLVGQITVGTALELTAVVSLPVISGAAMCSKSQLVASAEDVLDVVNSPAVIAALPPALASKLRGAEPLARSLVASIKAGDFSSALAAVNTLFPIIDEIAAALNASPKILNFVALANIGLHFIINHVRANLPSGPALTPSMSQAIDYGIRPAWGCDYHKNDKRCK